MSPKDPDASPAVLPWLAALVRAFSPVRWGLCLVGLTASGLIGALSLAACEGAPVRVDSWWQRPLDELERLADQLFRQGTGKAVFRGGLLAVVLGGIWGPIAGWIGRAEMLRRRRSENAEPAQLTPTRFVIGRAGTLVQPLLLIVVFLGILCLFLSLAGLINAILGWGVGALLVALVLPVVLVAALVAVVVEVGAWSYTIMPAAVAAEGSDVFDAVSRGYSYLFQRPVYFGWWSGLALAVSSLPLVGVFALRGPDPDLGSLGLGMALALSVFWSWQALAYLKLRRAVDDTPEDEICDALVSPGEPQGAAGRSNAEQPGPPADADSPVPEPKEASGPETIPEPVRPPDKPLAFADTLGGAPALDFQRLLLLACGLLWAALVLAGGAWVGWALAAGPRQGFHLESVRAAVLELAEGQPEALFGIALGTIMVAALGLARPLKVGARRAAVRQVYGSPVPLPAAWHFVGRTPRWGIGSVLLMAAGVELFLAALGLLVLAVQGACPWQEPAALGAWALGFLGLGAFGLAAVAVEDPQAEPHGGPLGYFLGNGATTLASAAANLVPLLVQSVSWAGLAALTWALACTSLSWWGGDNVHWVRWGLDGQLLPSAEGGLYWGAAALAGLWFVLIVGLVVAYPISYALSWGVACYLLARQKTDDFSPPWFELSPEERKALEEGKANVKKRRQRLQQRLQQKRSGQNT